MKNFTVRLTKSDANKLLLLKQETGKPKGELIRDAINSIDKNTKRVKLNKKQDRMLHNRANYVGDTLNEIHIDSERNGNNLNQVAHDLNILIKSNNVPNIDLLKQLDSIINKLIKDNKQNARNYKVLARDEYLLPNFLVKELNKNDN